MAYKTETSIIGLVNSGSTSDRFDVKYDFENGVTVYKKNIDKNRNNNFTVQYLVIVTNNTKNIFIFDNESDRDTFWGCF
jgi:hypothetical protein